MNKFALPSKIHAALRRLLLHYNLKNEELLAKLIENGRFYVEEERHMTHGVMA